VANVCAKFEVSSFNRSKFQKLVVKIR